MANCLSRHDQKVYSIFQKLCPSGHQGFLFKRFQGENEYLLGLPTMTTSSLENPITKTWKHFFIFFDCHNGFPLDLGDYKNKNGVATDLFCTGVIGHPGQMFLN